MQIILFLIKKPIKYHYSEVTEASLEVWRGLPAKIRQDPSMVSFQVENERLHGKKFSKNWMIIN